MFLYRQTARNAFRHKMEQEKRELRDWDFGDFNGRFPTMKLTFLVSKVPVNRTATCYPNPQAVNSYNFHAIEVQASDCCSPSPVTCHPPTDPTPPVNILSKGGWRRVQLMTRGMSTSLQQSSRFTPSPGSAVSAGQVSRVLAHKGGEMNPAAAEWMRTSTWNTTVKTCSSLWTCWMETGADKLTNVEQGRESTAKTRTRQSSQDKNKISPWQ